MQNFQFADPTRIVCGRGQISTLDALVPHGGRVLVICGGGPGGVRDGADDERIAAAIERTRAFFERLAVPTRLSEYGVSRDAIPEVARRLRARRATALGERRDITPAAVEEILQLCA